MKKERRWLKAAIAASTAPMPAMPWQRSAGHTAPTRPVTPRPATQKAAS